MSREARLWCAVLGMLAVSCADVADADSTNLSSARQSVYGGEISGDEDDFVVRLLGRQPEPYGDFSCTGTLLAPNLLLTALHCVAVFAYNGVFSCLPDGSLDPTLKGGWIGQTLDPGDIDVYFGTQLSPEVRAHATRILGSGSTTVCLDDIALVVLDTDLPVQGAPVQLERPLVAGETVTVIGYGLNEFADTPRARRSDVPVLDVGPDDTSGGVGVIAPRTFVVGDGPCRGENGAPALSDETAAVTGIFAYPFSGDCSKPGTRSCFTKLSPFASLVERAFEEAGQTPTREGQTSSTPAPVKSRAGSCALCPGGEPGLLAATLAALALTLARRRGSRGRGPTELG